MNSQDQMENQEGMYGPRNRRKTGPSPKYGPDQAKKMVSMRLSPDALTSIKEAAERVFRDSQADVIERVMRFLPPTILERVQKLATVYRTDACEILSQSLDMYEESKKTSKVGV